MSSRYIYIFRSRNFFLFLPGCTCVPFLLCACAGRVTFLATFCCVYPPYEVAMPSRQNVRNARSRALRAFEAPEERNRNRQQSKESDSILQPHQACMEQLQLQGTCIARFTILCYQSTSLVLLRHLFSVLKKVLHFLIKETNTLAIGYSIFFSWSENSNHGLFIGEQAQRA